MKIEWKLMTKLMIFIKEYFQSFLKLAVYLAVSCFAKAVCFDPVSWKIKTREN